MFTKKELEDIESWRNPTKHPTKHECHWMRQFKNRLLEIKEKRTCFCSKTERNAYKKSFYEWFDIQISSGQILCR